MKLSIQLACPVSLVDKASDYEFMGPWFKTWVRHTKMKFSQSQEVPYLDLFHLFKYKAANVKVMAVCSNP